MTESRRADERIQILGELPGAATVHQKIAVRELSRAGAQIETTVALQVDSLHEFRIALGSRSVVVKGRVVHCQIQDVDPDRVIYRAGLEFVEMPEWVARAITDFLESIKTGRIG